MCDCSLSKFITCVVNSLLADSYFSNSVWYVPRICANFALSKDSDEEEEKVKYVRIVARQ